ncbi:MAG: hypothetical protein Q4G09_06260 [Clostridia bacterium]|nr:hypothetical protein [Clostridia bacterium]
MSFNKIVSLTKIFLKNSFQNTKLNTKTKNNKIANTVLYMFLFIYIASIVGAFSYKIISDLVAIKQEAVFLGLFFFIIAAFIMFQSIFSCMNVFYFSKDIEFVLPLPLSAKEILIAKFNVILITEYIMELMIGIVPLAIYGILTGAGILYYITAIIFLIIFPILPLLLISFLVMLVMCFGKLTKKKDSFQVIATIIIIVFAMGISMLSSNTSEITDEQMMQNILNANGMVTIIQDYFITLKPTINALTTNNIITILLETTKVIGITFVAYLIFILLGQKLYFKGAIGNLVGGKTKTNKKINIERAYNQKKVGNSYVKKELKILFRNPTFFTQCVLPPILMPILFIGIFLFAGNNDAEAQLDLNSIFSSNIYSTITVCVLIGVTQFFNMMIYISATAISRDGGNAIFTKYIPISLYKQFIYKAMPNVILSAVTVFTVLAMYFYIIPQTSIIFLIAVFIISVILNIIHSYIGLIVDLKRPKLEWDTEYAVVKQNMNLVFPMGFALITIGIIALLGVLLYRLDYKITLLILFVLFGGMAYIIDRYVYKNQVSLFKKII